MREIKLTKGFKAKVDDEDFEWLNKFYWLISTQGYPYTNIKTEKGRKTILMHQMIAEMMGWNKADHINLDKLDNRKSTNLRQCTTSQNGANRGKNKNNTSGYKGVYLINDISRKKRWCARIQVNRKYIFLGNYETAKEAAVAYNKAAIKYFGEFARLNPI